MSFTKLDSGIVRSSIWSEPLHVRVLWITILALKDECGFVGTSKSGLIREANISREQFEEAIKVLESPDEESRSPDFEGRRVAPVDGGWIVLNSDKYRLPEQVKKEQRNEYMREYMREYRKNSGVNINKTLTPVNDALTSVSVSESVSSSVSLSQEGMQGEKPDKPDRPKWRENSPEGFEAYLDEAEKQFDALMVDPDWLIEQKTYYPDCALFRTLEKMWSQYWGTEAGWKNKRSKKSLSFDMKTTVEKTFQINRVFWGKQEKDTDRERIARLRRE